MAKATLESPSQRTVWVSSSGNVRWEPPPDEDILTLEERSIGLPFAAGVDFRTFGHAYVMNVDSHIMSEAGQKELNPDRPSSDIKWDKYHVLSWEEEQSANEVERALQEASIALAHAQTVDMAANYSGEWKSFWVKEYEKMHGDLEEVLRKDARGNLAWHRETHCRGRPLRSCSEACGGTPYERGCGNFENGVDNSGEPWTSSNVPRRLFVAWYP